MISRFFDFALTPILIIANFDFSIVNTIARHSVDSLFMHLGIQSIGIQSIGIQSTRYIVRIRLLLLYSVITLKLLRLMKNTQYENCRTGISFSNEYIDEYLMNSFISCFKQFVASYESAKSAHFAFVSNNYYYAYPP